MTDVDAKVRAAVKHVYDLVVSGKYEEIDTLTGGVRLSAAEIDNAVRSYRYALRHWPATQPMPIDAIEIIDSNPRAWSIQVDAYTAEEGRSDLTLELTSLRQEPVSTQSVSMICTSCEAAYSPPLAPILRLLRNDSIFGSGSAA